VALSAAAVAVAAKWDVGALCAPCKLKKLLQGTPGFIFVCDNGLQTVKLDITELRLMDEDAQAASCGRLTRAERAQLRQLVAALWPQDSLDGADHVKRIMAELLLEAPTLRRHQGAIGRVGQLVKGISNIQAVLLGDPSGCFRFMDAKSWHMQGSLIYLDATALIQYAQQQGLFDTSSEDDSSGGDDGGGDNEERSSEVCAPQQHRVRVTSISVLVGAAVLVDFVALLQQMPLL
jgi:hypothetical protein